MPCQLGPAVERSEGRASSPAGLGGQLGVGRDVRQQVGGGDLPRGRRGVASGEPGQLLPASGARGLGTASHHQVDVELLERLAPQRGHHGAGRSIGPCRGGPGRCQSLGASARKGPRRGDLEVLGTDGPGVEHAQSGPAGSPGGGGDLFAGEPAQQGVGVQLPGGAARVGLAQLGQDRAVLAPRGVGRALGRQVEVEQQQVVAPQVTRGEGGKVGGVRHGGSRLSARSAPGEGGWSGRHRQRLTLEHAARSRPSAVNDASAAGSSERWASVRSASSPAVASSAGGHVQRRGLSPARARRRAARRGARRSGAPPRAR